MHQVNQWNEAYPLMVPRYVFQDTVEVIVGKENTKFYVHPEVISVRYKFFKSALSQAWRNDKKPIDLSDTHPQTFSNYLKLLYQNDTSPAKNVENTFSKFTRLYWLADKLGDLQSTNATIDAIIKFSDQKKCVPSAPASVNLILRCTPDNSPLRQLLVDYFVNELKHEYVGEGHKRIDRGFLVRINKELIKNRAKRAIMASERTACYYHQHDDSCPRCEDEDDEDDDDDD